MFSFYDLILAMGIGWAFYGVINILTRPNRKERDTAFALAVLLCFTLPLVDNLIKPMAAPGIFILTLLMVTRNIYYLSGPMLWLYTRSLLKKEPVQGRQLLLHCLPFILWILVSLILSDQFVLFGPGISETAGPPRPPALGGRGAPIPTGGTIPLIRDMGTFLSPLCYTAFSLRQIIIHSKNVPDFYSNKSSGNTLLWLQILLSAIIGLFSTVVILSLIYFLFLNRMMMFTPSIRVIPSVLFIFYFSYFSKEQRIPEDTKENYSADKYQKSSMEEKELEKLYQSLTELMSEEKPYTNPDLTLADLSQQLETTKHHLSQVINMKTEGNFYNFINSYRIKEFTDALVKERFPQYTLIAIAFECGFRSSSAFYSLFKKAHGITPKEFIESLRHK